jgi:hypothetical protein
MEILEVKVLKLHLTKDGTRIYLFYSTDTNANVRNTSYVDKSYDLYPTKLQIKIIRTVSKV